MKVVRWMSSELGLRLIHRCLSVGILNLIILPFSFIYSIIYFFLDNAVHIHTEPKEFMSYTWTNYAYWTLKDYNELNHVTNQRLYLTLPYVIKFATYPQIVFAFEE